MKDPEEPVICERSEHNISRRDIDADALKVLYRLARHDHIAYLVGGSVRDLLLGRTPKDFDVSTDASPNQIRKMFRNCFLIGRRFRLAHIKYGNKIIETSTFRRQPQPDNGELLQLDDNEFGTPEEDAKRRDFTINGLFYNVENFCIIDYVGGLKDLQKRTIRSIGDPEIRFQEDPVRMVRAVRFASRLGFNIEKNTFNAIMKYAPELAKASAPRLLEEIYRLFAFNSGKQAIKLLYETTLLKVISPELDAYITKALASGQEPLIWNFLEALDRGDLIVNETSNALMLASMFFPAMLARIDKSDSAITQKKLLASFIDLGLPFLERFRVPRRTKEKLVKILTLQHRFMSKNRRSFNKVRFAATGWFLDSLALHELYLTAAGKDFSRADEWRRLWEQRQEELEIENREETDTTEKKSRRRRNKQRRNKRKKKTELDNSVPVDTAPATPVPDTAKHPKRLDDLSLSPHNPEKRLNPAKPLNPMIIMQEMAKRNRNC